MRRSKWNFENCRKKFTVCFPLNVGFISRLMIMFVLVLFSGFSILLTRKFPYSGSNTPDLFCRQSNCLFYFKPYIGCLILYIAKLNFRFRFDGFYNNLKVESGMTKIVIQKRRWKTFNKILPKFVKVGKRL